MKHIQQAGGIVVGPQGAIAIITSKTGRKTFPKGSQEVNETLIDTARREIYEETGLQNLVYQIELGEIVRPGFTAENLETPSVIKHIHMFLFTTPDTGLQPRETDVLAAEWINTNDLLPVLSWPEEADFFAQHRNALKI